MNRKAPSSKSAIGVSKEEHYRRLNAELEAKTASLFKEADLVLKTVQAASFKENPLASPASFDTDKTSSTPMQNVEEADEIQTGPMNSESPEDPVNGGDILTEPTQHLSLKSQNRCLQARVRVLQEELQKLGAQLRTSHDENAILKKRLQESEDERTRLQRANTGHTGQLEKLKRNFDEVKASCDALNAECGVLKKENNLLKRSSTQQEGELKSVSARVQRLTEENERLRTELSKSRTAVRDINDGMKHTVDQLTADNRRLERQKSELITAFKKQLRLIDVLKKQKMLLEASRSLQLTEEEFLNTLDGKT